MSDSGREDRGGGGADARLGAGEPGRPGGAVAGAGRELGAPIVSGFSSTVSSRKRIGPIASSSPS